MMHQWESLEKMVKSWEDQEVKDPFVYINFAFKLEEWDNVPPVIPRFQFYLQNCLAHTVKFAHEVNNRQTTQDLNKEMYENFDLYNGKLLNEEKGRKDDVAALHSKDDSLQSQIDGLNKHNKDREDHDIEYGK